MFKSKTRPIIFTQYEHARLSGTLARLWGNETFDRPDLDFDAFVAGVTLHDWAYGPLDDLSIGESSDDEWLAVMRKGVSTRFDDPTTDIVAKLHLRRLLSGPDPESQTLMAQVDEIVSRRLRESPFTLASYQQADRITNFCDLVSFDLCFESPRQRAREVFSRYGPAAAAVEVSYEVRAAGEVIVDPWPFSVPRISGVLYAFERAGYPRELHPVVVGFDVDQAAERR